MRRSARRSPRIVRSRKSHRNGSAPTVWTRNFGFPTEWSANVDGRIVTVTLEASRPMHPAIARVEIDGRLAGRYESLTEAKEAVEAELASVADAAPTLTDDIGTQTTMGAALLSGRPDVLVSQETIEYDARSSPYQRAVYDFIRFGKGNAIVEAVAGSGKAQPVDAMELTPNGYVRMGDVRVGDTVIGRSGEHKTVIGVFPQGVKPVFRLTLANGASTECTDDHLWLVQSDDAADGVVKRFAEVMQSPDSYRVPMAFGGWSSIASIVPVGEKECQCISVGGDGLYVTDDGIVTHNTTTLMKALEYIPRNAAVLILAFNTSIALELQSRAPRGRNLTIKTLAGWGNSFLSRHWKTGMASPAEGKRRDAAVIAESIPSFRESGLAHGDIKIEGTYAHLSAMASKLIGLCMAYMATTTEAITETQREHELFVDDNGDPEGFVLYGTQGPAGSHERPVKWTHRDVVSWVKTAMRLQLIEPRKGGSISFRDMVFVPAMNTVWKAPELYDFVFVDETQDCDPAQLSLVMRAVKPRGRIVVIGDRNQSIYAFRGADTDAMPRLERELNATRLPLSVSYRVTQCAAEEARKVVPEFEIPKDEYGRPLATPGVCNEISAHRMANLWDAGDVVISRNRGEGEKGASGFLGKIALKVFATGKVPYVLGDTSALTNILTGAIRETRPLMRTGKDSIEDFRVALDEWVNRGQQRFRLHLIEVRKKQVAEGIPYRGYKFDDNVDTFEDWKRFDEIASCFFNGEGTGVAQQEGVQTLGQIEDRIRQLSPDDEVIEKMTPERFKRLTSQCVTISTVHQIKGAEFNRVFVLESTFSYTRKGPKFRRKQRPKQAIEEKNLWYVAITRVKGERGDPTRGIPMREGELYYVNDIEALVNGRNVKDLKEVMK